MEINASISLDKNDIMDQPKENISLEVSNHLAMEIAKQIVQFVHKEMETNDDGPTHDDPFQTRITFRVRAELRESRHKSRDRDRERMRTMMNTQAISGDSPFSGMSQRERSDRMRGVYTTDVYNGDPLAKPATVQQFDHERAERGRQHRLYQERKRMGQSSFQREYMLDVDPDKKEGE